MPDDSISRRTPVHDWHRRAGGRLVEFAGWELPVQYAGGVLAEHRAVRSAAGLFDVSHMGEIWVRGPGALDLLQWLTPNDVSRLSPGRAQYSALLTERGTIIDDLLVYRYTDDRYLLVVNAANGAIDLQWLTEHCSADSEVEDRSERTSLFALQGPLAVDILGRLVDAEIDTLPPFSFVEAHVAGVPATISRTGYTGEDGFEIYLPTEQALSVWETLMDDGGPLGLEPIGLGARDTLRLEAGLMLHGNDIDDTVTPLEAGLGWVVKLGKGDFIGRAALVEQKRVGLSRRLVGLQLEGRRIARHGATVLQGDEPVGTVTSGSWSPTLERAVAMAFVAEGSASSDCELELEIRGRRSVARRVRLPFYRRQGR